MSKVVIIHPTASSYHHANNEMDAAKTINMEEPTATRFDAPPEGAAGAATEAAAAVAIAPTPERLPTPLSCGKVVPRASAAAWKLANVFPDVGGLIAPTIPEPQWLWGVNCLQKNQIG